MNEIYEIYKILYKTYGPQGWWPITTYGYHKGDYSFPRNEDERFEICLGSILTQNTTFISVAKALKNLHNRDALNVNAIEKMDREDLKEAIKTSGYYNQKAKYILEFTRFFKSLKGKVPSREALLHIKGIGEETADSILLYAYRQREFKVDAYTKRLLSHLGLIDEKAKYRDIKYLMQNALKECVREEELLKVYMEFHALLVEHGKRHYSKKPYATVCPLKKKIAARLTSSLNTR